MPIAVVVILIVNVAISIIIYVRPRLSGWCSRAREQKRIFGGSRIESFKHDRGVGELSRIFSGGLAFPAGAAEHANSDNQQASSIAMLHAFSFHRRVHCRRDHSDRQRCRFHYHVCPTPVRLVLQSTQTVTKEGAMVLLKPHDKTDLSWSLQVPFGGLFGSF